MKAFNKKKGFTIVELVIVIAVIGVLTAVLVPTFVNLVNKANNASDESLVNNLNKQLAIKRATEGDNKTMQDALDDALEGGYKVENLTPTAAGKDIIWSAVEDKFFYVDSDKAPADGKSSNLYDYFKVYTTMPTTQTFSIYAKGTNWTSSIDDLKVGFDAGENEGIPFIEYNNTAAKNVVIRTNGTATDLVIDGPNDIVRHYGVVYKLTINSIASASYHEFGSVLYSMTVSDGHVVIEEDADVKEIIVPGDATAETSVSVEKGADVDNLVIDSSTAGVEIASGATVEQVVGETGNISGTGASEAVATAVAKTLVTNKDELFEAVADAEIKYILFGADIALAADPVEITRSVTIDGDGHSLTMTASGSDKRTMNVFGSDIDVFLKHLDIVGPTGGYSRGLNVGKGNPSVYVDDCEVSAGHYALNLIGSASKVHMNISNSHFKGYCAAQSWGSLNVINISNSIMEGINDKPAGSSNSFGAIVLEGDTTFATTEGAEKIKFNIVGGEIVAKTTTTNYQGAILFNPNSIGNEVVLSGVTITLVGDNARAVMVGAAGLVDVNSLTIDGEVVF